MELAPYDAPEIHHIGQNIEREKKGVKREKKKGGEREKPM